MECQIKAEKRIARLNQKLTRSQVGSKNREKVRIKLAKLHEKVANQRADFLHKLSKQIIDENQVIVVEKRNVIDMVQKATKSDTKAILDAAWSEFIRQLEYKAKWYGRTFITVPPALPYKQMCSNCGCVLNQYDLGEEWQCSRCHTQHITNINTAINILDEGLRTLCND